MNLRNELALMYRGGSKEFFHNNILIKVVFESTGTFDIHVCDPETKDVITHFSSTSLKECVDFLERF